MKISANIDEDTFTKLYPHIDCDEWANPMEDEFIFYNPKNSFLVVLALFAIPYYKDE